MIPDLSKFIDLGGTLIIAIMALWAVVQVARIKKNGSSPEIKEIKEQLGNHMTDYKRELQYTNNRLTNVETDVKIIKGAVNDIKMKMK